MATLIRNNSSKLTIPELYTELRLQGYCKLSNIDWAVIEPVGKISLIGKPGAPSPVVCIEPVIIDGVIQQEPLHLTGKDAAWLQAKLEHSGFLAPSEILIAEIAQENVVNFIAKH